MQKTKLVNLQHFIEDNGYLTVVQEKSGVMPFPMVRLFNVCANKGDKRGEHAHKKCSQFFLSIFGKINLYIETPDIKKKITLNHTSKTGVLVPPKYWCSIKFVTKNSILMVACDQHYNVNDYLKNFNVYKKYLRKK